jgi:GNAT superfamily N-acetyltransferase
MDTETGHTETGHTGTGHTAPTTGEVIVRVPMTHPDAQLLIGQVQAEYVVRYGGIDATPVDPAMFEPPAGAFFVAYRDGVPVATGAWRLREDVDVLVEGRRTRRAAEVKRMYVAPAARGTGLARRMLARLEDTAADVGSEAVILETGTAQPEALELYESSGYARIESFGHYKWAPGNRCYGVRLPRE